MSRQELGGNSRAKMDNSTNVLYGRMRAIGIDPDSIHHPNDYPDKFFTNGAWRPLGVNESIDERFVQQAGENKLVPVSIFGTIPLEDTSEETVHERIMIETPITSQPITVFDGNVGYHDIPESTPPIESIETVGINETDEQGEPWSNKRHKLRNGRDNKHKGPGRYKHN